MKNKIRSLSIMNAISVVIMIGTNYYSQVFGINGNQVGSLSDRYDNYFTPDGYAFAIWGIIFLSLIAYSVYQIWSVFFKKRYLKEYESTGIWFFLVNILNATWVIVWLYELTWLSVIVMSMMLLGLLKIIINTNMEKWDAGLKTIAFIWWPICLYSGWITVAFIANISAYLSKSGWTGGFLSEIQWTILMIVAATLINLFMVVTRNMREFALVGVWALIAIYMRHNGTIDSIALTAIGGAVVLLIVVAVHGYKNRETSPFAKLMK